MIEIIPAIDLIDGKCVRLTQGDYESMKVYNADPLETARSFEDCGMRRLHVVDLDGARAGHIVHYRILEMLAARTSLTIDFGGGLQSDGDVEIAFNSGATMVTGGSVAVKEPETFASWLRQFGGERIILGADCRGGKIAVAGWTEETSEEVLPFILRWRKEGVRQAICTDIGKDGTMEGANIELYRRIKEADASVRLIASGGIGSIGDIERLNEADIPAVIVGKALYEGKIRLNDLLRFTCSGV
jgi:phosphoribosylformimino-5-aminoimidazole carboxamide ribotide isomerase